MNDLNAPLIVDLDGTLTTTDTLVESVFQVLKRSPLQLFQILVWLFKGRAILKAEIASRTTIDPQLLPYRQDLLAFLLTEKSNGRTIVLATAAHQSIADAVAAHLKLFDLVLASDASANLKGVAKLQAIHGAVGPHFVYAGDSYADLPIWQAASAAILVGVSPSLAATVRSQVDIEREFEQPVGHTALAWVRALRLHQWLKNLLIFVPLLTTFSFTSAGPLGITGLAFLAFSLTASATYLVNDLWDLGSDRAHPRKRLRPFACARLPIIQGVPVAATLLALALVLGWYISVAFVGILIAYLIMTSIYSALLKDKVLVDVVMLSVLYTIRILAGAVAIGVLPSEWLLAFSVFIFLSLALVKRCSELVSLRSQGKVSTLGRDYWVDDLVVLWPMGVAAAMSSVVVFGLFINSAETHVRYSSPALLWLVAIVLTYWLGRLWIKTARGEMHDDPVIFAAKDQGSQVAIFVMVMIAVLSRFLTIGT